jgi:anaerobic magnesium-protoporphyrin IX monomethyl ester cyclase
MSDRLAATGCNLISFGFESGSNHKLKLMKKQTTREQNLAAGKIWKKTGKLILANLLAAIPGETEADLAEDFSFIDELRPTMYYFNWMVPFPGSKYYEELLATDMLLTNDLNLFEMNMVHNTPLTKNVDYDMVLRWEKKFQEAFI